MDQRKLLIGTNTSSRRRREEQQTDQLRQFGLTKLVHLEIIMHRKSYACRRRATSCPTAEFAGNWSGIGGGGRGVRLSARVPDLADCE